MKPFDRIQFCESENGDTDDYRARRAVQGACSGCSMRTARAVLLVTPLLALEQLPSSSKLVSSSSSRGTAPARCAGTPNKQQQPTQQQPQQPRHCSSSTRDVSTLLRRGLSCNGAGHSG